LLISQNVLFLIVILKTLTFHKVV